MKYHKTAKSLVSDLNLVRNDHRSIGFVPTMGALHHGHISLIERAKAENDTVVCSIFVNPKQFNNESDLVDYPKSISADMELLLEHGADFLYHPAFEDVYPNDPLGDDIELNGLDAIYEGKHRPGHFKGVAQVVHRFFQIVQPNTAYFGQKDFQQTVVVNHLIRTKSLPIKLIVCPIVRESNGLAMSSRNERLSLQQRNKASFIYQALLKLKERTYFMPLHQAVDKTRLHLSGKEGATLEYLHAVDGVTMAEVQLLEESDYVVVVTVVEFGGVRLLDNIILKSPVSG
ncbi:MAG: pantoate--beta-alanine ligase [Bacteroidia bacterium]|jgi:pantoate--beta-alanine ligase